MFSTNLYECYGLCIESRNSLPGLRASSKVRDPDIHLEVAEGPKSPFDTFGGWRLYPPADELDDTGVAVTGLPQAIHFRYMDSVEFLIEQNGVVRMWWPKPLCLNDAVVYFVGPVVGYILRLRGVLALHASVVEIDNRAVAFMGAGGAGKSTIAASLSGKGFKVISDDVAALDFSREKITVQTGPQRILLWPSSTAMLFGSPDALPLISPTWTKRQVLDEQKFCTVSRPLAAIYLLRSRCLEASAPRVEMVEAGEAFISVVANTYVTYLLDRDARRREFTSVRRLLEAVPVRALVPHCSSERLDALCERVVNDVRHGGLPIGTAAQPAFA